MVNYTQKIRRQQSKKFLIVFDHFVMLALKWLSKHEPNHFHNDLAQKSITFILKERFSSQLLGKLGIIILRIYASQLQSKIDFFIYKSQLTDLVGKLASIIVM